jgi:hypothetical protein
MPAPIKTTSDCGTRGFIVLVIERKGTVKVSNFTYETQRPATCYVFVVLVTGKHKNAMLKNKKLSSLVNVFFLFLLNQKATVILRV